MKKKRSRVRQLLQDLYSPGRWLQVPMDFFLLLGGDEAILLSYLVNKAEAVQAEERYNGWFYCKMTEVMDKFLISKNTQTRWFASLEKKGYIKTRKKGLPAKRYIKLNYIKLMDDAQLKRDQYEDRMQAFRMQQDLKSKQAQD